VKPRRVLILDGYTDEPAGFGVPPYIDVYPRYIAGAFWDADKSTTVHYVTVDEARRDIAGFLRRAAGYDTLVVIAGAVVPGRYLGGSPITLEELKTWFRVLEGPFKILVGAAARWGIGNEGGSVAALPGEVRDSFDVIVTGDPEAYIADYVRWGPERAEPWRQVEDMALVDRVAVLGARIVEQHPNHGYNLIAEIETYRSCPRWVSGGCSFCVTKLYGRPRARSLEGVVREVEALYRHGVRHFRVGRQADILVYGSPELETEEWPKPSPEAIRRLFYGIRSVAPGLKTLHIDNVNPGTIVRHVEESVEVLKAIIEYHTPGDVAALGIETADPRVVKVNNLKTGPEESLEAIRVIHRLGHRRGYNGLPELLPGVNFVLGLPGETAETYRLNEEFIQRLYEEGLLVRRINVRKVLVLPGTGLQRLLPRGLPTRLAQRARRFQRLVMEYSARLLRRLVPPGTVLRGLYVEKVDERLGVTFARQAGSYPLVAELPCRLRPPLVVDVVVYGYAGRSVRALPVPLDANRAPLGLVSKIVGAQAARAIAAARPVSSEWLRARGLGAVLAAGRGFRCA
jgi:radical SAM superfamily enzyme with C-terminal helix-hairpin-helix motif